MEFPPVWVNLAGLGVRGATTQGNRGSLSCISERDLSSVSLKEQTQLIINLELLAHLCKDHISTELISLPISYTENGSLI